MRRIIAALFAFAATAVAVLVGPTPAHATTIIDTQTPKCDTAFATITAVKIQEDNEGQDEIFVKMNGTRYPLSGNPRTFTPGQTRPGTDFRSDANSFTFAGVLTLQLVEDDGLINDVWGHPPAELTCPADFNPHTFLVQFFVRQDVQYDLIFTLQRI
jgi:hypothetical protein